MTREDVVREFHKSVGLALDDLNYDVHNLVLRMKLLKEEYEEVKDEMSNCIFKAGLEKTLSTEDKVALVKELADLQYVLSGLAVTFNLPLEEAFNRVHISNMSKLGEDGKPIYREDGKVLKGPNYQPAVLEDLFNV